MFKELKNFKQHAMSGISYMIPVIVLAGFATAMARMIGDVDVQGSLGFTFLAIGNAGFNLMIAVLTAGVAYSMVGKPGIAPGVVVGYLSTTVKAGFLGGLIGGAIIGIIIMFFNKVNVPKSMKPMMPIVVLPVISGLVASLTVMFVIGPPIAILTEFLVGVFMNMQTGSRFVLGFLLGCMTGFDMGGPVNKIGFSIVSAFAAEGIWGPAAGKNAAAMAPPLGMAISALLLTPKKYTTEEKEDAKVAILMSAFQVTEGALPFAFSDPIRVVPAVTIGSGVAHGLILSWFVEVPVLHGGIFSIPLVNNPLLFVAALFIGALVTAVIVSVLKPKEPVVKEIIEEITDLDIEFSFSE